MINLHATKPYHYLADKPWPSIASSLEVKTDSKWLKYDLGFQIDNYKPMGIAGIKDCQVRCPTGFISYISEFKSVKATNFNTCGCGLNSGWCD